jgi:pyruvate/oxaloacetate carboxyltransferase
MNIKEYFEELKQKYNNMSDEEFMHLVDSTIEETELVGGLTTKVRWDILIQSMIEEEYVNSYNYFLNDFIERINNNKKQFKF